MSRIDDLLAQEGAAAENHPGGASDDVRVERPNLGNATVISVRVSAGEHARLQKAADGLHLPISTTIRLLALDRLAAQEAEAGIVERLARLEAVVFSRSA